MTMECLLNAEPEKGAVEVAVSHRAETFAFIELTLLHKTDFTALWYRERRTQHLTGSS